MNRDLKSYIEINRWYMTTKEMAEELGVPESTVRSILHYNKWEAVSESDRLREYLVAHPNCILEDVAEVFGVSPASVRYTAGTIGLKLTTRGQVKRAVRDETPPEPQIPQDDLKQRKEMLEWAKEQGYGYIPKPRQDRIKEAYTQSGSPYGFADELRKIKTK